MRFLTCLLLLSACSSQVSPLIETHELRNLQAANSTFHLLEVIGLEQNKDYQHEPRIPSAVFINMRQVLDITALPKVKTLDTEVFTEVMKTYGLKLDDTLAVVYDAKGMREASMFWWLLRLYGRFNVRVLNGGLPKWRREDNPIVQGGSGGSNDPSLEDPSLYPYALDTSRLWTCADLMNYQAYPDTMPLVQILDVRPKNDFDLSHIASSINMPADIISRADGTMRTAIELRSMFEDYGVSISNDHLSVVISGKSLSATRVLLALTSLGKENAANVEGGWEVYLTCEQPKPSEVPATPEPEPSPPPSVPEPASPSGEPAQPSVPEPSPPVVDSNSTAPAPPAVTPPESPVTALQSCIHNPTLSKANCFGTSSVSDFADLLQTTEGFTALSNFMSCTHTCNSVCSVAQFSGADCKEKCAFIFCVPSSPPASNAFFYSVALTLGLIGLVCMGYAYHSKAGVSGTREYLLSK